MPLYTSVGIWNGWVTSGTSTSTSNTIWTGWIDSAATMSNTVITASNTWTYWCENTIVTNGTGVYVPPQVTPEQTAEREARIAEFQARADALKLKRAAAEARAEALLLECLDLRQQLDYKQNKSFVVHGASGYRYRIRHGRSGNIDVVNREGLLEKRLCVHPQISVPDCDTMLAQKLMLEHDEATLLRTANHHPLWGDNERRNLLEPLH